MGRLHGWVLLVSMEAVVERLRKGALSLEGQP